MVIECMFMDIHHRFRVLKLTELVCPADNLSAQAKYRAIPAIRWRYGSRIKYRVRMRLGSVVPEDGLRYTDWSNVPYLNRWDDDRQLKLNDNWADNRNDNWSSPSVRDCS